MNKILKYLFFHFLLAGQLSFAYGQLNPADSLKLALKNAKHDTTRCSILNAMIEDEEDEKIWSKYNEQLKELSEKNIKSNDANNKIYLKYLATYLYNVGFSYDNKGDVTRALDYHKRSLKIREEIGDKQGIAFSLDNLASIYDNQGDIAKSLECYHKSLKIREETNDKAGVAESMNNLGVIYNFQGETVKALEYFWKSLELKEEMGDKKGVANALNNLGFMYDVKKDYVKALDCHERSLKIRKELNDKRGMAFSLSNIGDVYQARGDIKKTLDYFYESLRLREEINDKKGVAYSLNNTATLLYKIGRSKEAMDLAIRGMNISKELGFPEFIRNAAATLKRIYKHENKFKEAFDMYRLEIKMRDSVSNQETQKAAVKKQMQYEHDKKELIMKAEQDKKDLISAEELKQKEKERNYFIAGFGLVIILALFIFRGYRQKQNDNKLITLQKHLVEEKQKEILDSIHYAKRIQSALMISEQNMGVILKRLRKN